MNIMTRTPRILEDAPRKVVVETKARKSALSPAKEAAEAVFRPKVTPADHAVAALAAVNSNVAPTTYENAYPGNLAFIARGDVTLSAAQATEIASKCTHPVQQSIRPLDHPTALEHISVLSAIMQTPDAWLDETQIRFGVLDGRLWLMDGNHRIRAQAKSGVAMTWNVKIDEYRTEEDFTRAFHKFNTNSRNRSESQILGAAGIATRLGIAKQTASSAYNAMPIIIAEFRTGRNRDESEIRRSRIVDTRLKMVVHNYGEEAKAFDEILRVADKRVKKRLLAAGVTAVVLVTLKAAPEMAKVFWSDVARNDGLRKGDPRHTLAMDLLTRTLNKGAAHQAIYAPAEAWNAWCKGRKLDEIKVVDTKAIVIHGTTFQG